MNGGSVTTLLIAIAAISLTAACGLGGADNGGAASDTDIATQPAATPIVIDDEPTAVPTRVAVNQEPATTDEPGEVTETNPANAPIAECALVPTYFAADTISVACVDDIAVSPELFANNAGWHVFRSVDGAWNEIDYALTCCGADEEATFVELLARNGLTEPQVAALCADSGLAQDRFSGCDADTDTDTDADAGDAADAAGAVDAETAADVDLVELTDVGWLRVNGLGDFDFGSNDTAVQQAVADVFGPALTQAELVECGAGPMTAVTWDDFTLNFQAGAFIGWFYTSSAPALTSPSGVAPGISEADLAVAYQGVAIFTDSLGKEFSFQVPAGFMGGFFNDDGTTVASMFAGSQCFFR